MNESIPTASFNTWTSIFLIFSILGFILTAIIWSKNQDRKQNWPIILLVFSFSLVLIQYVFVWTGFRQIYPYVYFFDSTWTLAYGPLIYTYVVHFYQPKLNVGWYHYLPAMIALVFISFFLIPTAGFTNFSGISESPLQALMWRLKNPWISLISLAVYYFLTKDAVKIFDIKNEKTEAYQIRDRWVKMILNFFALFTFAYWSYYILILLPFFDTNWDYAISCAMSIGIYGIGLMVYKENQIFTGQLWASIFLPKQSETKLTPAIKAQLFQKLTSLMEQEKPYLDNDLRMIHLADKVGFSPHLLSQIINEKSEKNFNQFINHYRLEAATDLLTQYPRRSIKSILFEVGFNNKTTFNQAFREKYDCTPSQFKKQIKG